MARLKRSRSPFHRAQYLRIQALHLEESGVPELVVPALSLLEHLVRECPERSQLSAAHHQRALCHVDLGELEAAIDAFRAAFVARRASPNWQNDAPLDFGELVCSMRRVDLYAEVTAVLCEFADSPLFPVQQYKHAAVHAVLAAARDEHEVARAHAREALRAMNATESSSVRHRRLGLVRFVDPHLLETLRAITA
ncbi:MAG: hypothetical protein V4813_14870 [Gemmatimonadota bacterium]